MSELSDQMTDDTFVGLDGITYTREFWARWGKDPDFKTAYITRGVKRLIEVSDAG